MKAGFCNSLFYLLSIMLIILGMAPGMVHALGDNGSSVSDSGSSDTGDSVSDSGSSDTSTGDSNTGKVDSDSGSNDNSSGSGSDSGSLDPGSDNGSSDSGSNDNSSDSGSDSGSLDPGSDNGSSDSGSDNGSSDPGSDNGSSDSGSDNGSSDSGSDNGSLDPGSDNGSSDTNPDDNSSDSGSDNGSSDTNSDNKSSTPGSDIGDSGKADSDSGTKNSDTGNSDTKNSDTVSSNNGDSDTQNSDSTSSDTKSSGNESSDTESTDNVSSDTGSEDSGSSSDSGMSLVSSESATNIAVKELSTRSIIAGYPVQFDFTKNATCIVQIEFDPKKTFRKTTTVVEELKNRSTLVPNSPEGTVYKYVNIWVGENGAGLPSSISSGFVEFKVEKAWIKDNNISEAQVVLQRYDVNWQPLYTEKVAEDENYIYFKSETPGYSFFAITEYTGQKIMKVGGIQETLKNLGSEGRAALYGNTEKGNSRIKNPMGAARIFMAISLPLFMLIVGYFVLKKKI